MPVRRVVTRWLWGPTPLPVAALPGTPAHGDIPEMTEHLFTTDVAPGGTAPGGLHRFACLMVVLTVGLIAAGAMVTSTGSGLSVPDWPQTYGENMFLFPPSKWVGGIFYEHGHRLFAATIGFLTIILAIYTHLRAGRRSLRVLGWVALAAVIAQGILGGMTVRFLLPTWISVFHACLAQTFLCILVTIAVLTRRERAVPAQADRRPVSRAPDAAMLLVPAVIFMQLIAGALMRHTSSGLAVPDFPLAYGQVIPTLDAAAMQSYNDARAFDHHLPPVTRAQVITHLVHRAGALIVVAVVLIGTVMAARATDRTALRAIVWVILLVAAQIILGMYTVWSQKRPAIATAHVAVGAATLAAAWRMFLLARQARQSARRPAAARVEGAFQLIGGAA